MEYDLYIYITAVIAINIDLSMPNVNCQVCGGFLTTIHLHLLLLVVVVVVVVIVVVY